MLLQFSVSNYSSIKEECILSLIPSADKEHQENIIKNGKYNALNMTSIYGANASGKTRLFSAMTSAINIIRRSNQMQINDSISVVPFKFSKETIGMPSKFEFVFVGDDGLKYIYGFSADAQKVHEEYLYCYFSVRPKMIFDRKFEKYNFSRDFKTELSPLIERNTSNKLFFATSTMWNAECTKEAFNWFSKKIDTYTNDDYMINVALKKYSDGSNEYIDFTKNLLKQADINISDINVELKKNNDSLNGIIVNGQIVQSKEHIDIQIKTGHIIENKNSSEKYELTLQEESLGTQQLFFIAPMLKEALESGKTLFIDELDRSMHPFIVKYIVNLFRNKDINNNGAQLIFTTHETTLLSLDTFRRDQIYFTEKDSKTGVTDLYSLDEFSIRKTENIEKGYLLGRYGAIPFLHTEEII